MKRLLLLLTLVVLVAALPALAEVTTNEKVPIFLNVFVQCANGGTGEVVHFEGILHETNIVVINNNTIVMRSHFQPMGLRGVGSTTGDKYQATGVTQFTNKWDVVNGFPSTYTYVNNYKIIGQGHGNNFLIHQNIHVTVNANGETTTQVDNFRTECK